ncbi:MAG: hypothetical protein ACTHOD_21580 [Motilibacteraceae bacterium]
MPPQTSPTSSGGHRIAAPTTTTDTDTTDTSDTSDTSDAPGTSPGQPTRRAVLVGALAGGAAALAGGLPLLPGLAAPAAAAAGDPLPLVASLAQPPARAAFAPQEQQIAGFLLSLAPMANGISTAPDTYGWLRGGWGGRSPDKPYNARIQENVATMAWFAANERPWNPYVGDQALLARLDVALGYYLGLQHADGSWSEYAPDEHSRAATGFGMSALAMVVRNLAKIGALPETTDRVRGALERAARWFLDPQNGSVWTEPVQEYANQAFGGLFAAVEVVAVTGASDLQPMVDERIRFMRESGQSPAGYFYEPKGQDLGYNDEVMLPDVAKLWSLQHSPVVHDMAEDFYGWWQWNFVREPDGAGNLGNVASSARTYMVFRDDVPNDGYKATTDSLLAPTIPLARAFEPSVQQRAAQRASWAASPDPVKPSSPYYTIFATVRDMEYGEAFPSQAAKDRAVESLPYLEHKTATEWRRDPLGDRQWVYVRRPSWFLGAHFGNRASGLVRTGPAFLWHPAAGMLVHSLNTGDDSAWTTFVDGRADADQDVLDATYYAGDPRSGREVPDPRSVRGAAPVGMRWTGFDGALVKDVVVGAGQVLLRTTTDGEALEQLPLVLHASDNVSWTGGGAVAYGGSSSGSASGLRIRRGGVSLRLEWGRVLEAQLVARKQVYFRAADRRLHALLLLHAGPLEIRITTDEEG